MNLLLFLIIVVIWDFIYLQNQINEDLHFILYLKVEIIICIIWSWKKYKNLLALNSEENNAYLIVLSLINGIEGKGYSLYYNSWYSLIILTNKLTDLGFKTIIILRKNVKFLPNIKKYSKNYCYNQDSHSFI